MNYFSQTGNTIINTKISQSTAPNTDKKDGIVFSKSDNVVYKVSDKANFLGGVKKNNEDVKDELSKEEEDKFYKKVFKTSLI